MNLLAFPLAFFKIAFSRISLYPWLPKKLKNKLLFVSDIICSLQGSDHHLLFSYFQLFYEIHFLG